MGELVDVREAAFGSRPLLIRDTRLVRGDDEAREKAEGEYPRRRNAGAVAGYEFGRPIPERIGPRKNRMEDR